MRGTGAFTLCNLYFNYDLEGQGWLQDLSLSLNIDNVFDKDPIVRLDQPGSLNGGTYGRLVQVGVRKRF